MAEQYILDFEDVDAVERDFQGLLTPIANNRTSYATHGIHYYPATFIPQFPAFFIPRFSREGDLVVDPMCGAGTTIIEAALQRRRFFGCDIDPIATLISKVATTPLPGVQTESEFSDRILHLLSRVYEATTPERLRKVDLPSETDFPNTLLWFREEVLRELIAVRDAILEEDNEDFKDFALLCLSAIVRPVSNADPRDIFPQRDAKNPIRERRNTVKDFVDSLWTRHAKVVVFSRAVSMKSLGEAIRGDAREMALSDRSAQLVFTSPPYAYAIDYARVQQLSTLLLTMSNPEFREYRRRYIGTDRVSMGQDALSFSGIDFVRDDIERVIAGDTKRGLVLYQYFVDMHQVTKECYRILKPNGYLVYVVGNSTVRGTTFGTKDVFETMCRNAGFEIENVLERPYYVYRMSRKRNVQSNTVKSDYFIVAKKRGSDGTQVQSR